MSIISQLGKILKKKTFRDTGRSMQGRKTVKHVEAGSLEGSRLSIWFLEGWWDASGKEKGYCALEMKLQCAFERPWRWFKRAQVLERHRNQWERRKQERFTGSHQLYCFTDKNVTKIQVLHPCARPRESRLFSSVTRVSPHHWGRGEG